MAEYCWLSRCKGSAMRVLAGVLGTGGVLGWGTGTATCVLSDHCREGEGLHAMGSQGLGGSRELPVPLLAYLYA